MARGEPQKMKLEQDALGPTNANTHHGRRRMEHLERYTFRIGDCVKEVVVFDGYHYRKPGPNVACQEWIRELHRVDRLMSRSAKGSGSTSDARRPRTIGFTCRRHVEEPFFMSYQEHQAIRRQGVLPPLSMIAVCFGGTHCAAITLPPGGFTERWGPNVFPTSMRAFLSDPRFSFVGHNVTREAARLNDDWGVPVANVRELVPMVSEAFHEEWQRGDFGRNGKVKLEALAYGVLDGVVVEEEPQKYRSKYSRYERRDVIPYVIRDACLAYEIAEKCEERLRGRGRR